MNLPEMTRRLQRHVGATESGMWNEETAEKTLDYLAGRRGSTEPRQSEDTNVANTGAPVMDDRVDDRSEKVFARLQPVVIPKMRKLVHLARAEGIEIVATSGLRTYEEQNELYAKGRTKPGPRVTNVRGGYSSHNFGFAVDFTIFKNGKPVWESPLYKRVGELAKSIGLDWGGDWTDPVDEPHVYYTPPWAKGMTQSTMMANMRKRVTTQQPLA